MTPHEWRTSRPRPDLIRCELCGTEAVEYASGERHLARERWGTVVSGTPCPGTCEEAVVLEVHES